MLFERISRQRDPAIATQARHHSRQESGATAGLLACLAVFDERRAFSDLGYPSMLEYCQHDLALSEDVAKKSLRASRIARERPVLFDMLADRRLSVSAVLTLGPWLESGANDDLIAAAVGRSREEIEWLIASRCPRSEMLSLEADACAAATSAASLQVTLEGAPGPACPSTAPESPSSLVPLLPVATLKPRVPHLCRRPRRGVQARRWRLHVRGRRGAALREPALARVGPDQDPASLGASCEGRLPMSRCGACMATRLRRVRLCSVSNTIASPARPTPWCFTDIRPFRLTVHEAARQVRCGDPSAPITVPRVRSWPSNTPARPSPRVSRSRCTSANARNAALRYVPRRVSSRGSPARWSNTTA